MKAKTFVSLAVSVFCAASLMGAEKPSAKIKIELPNRQFTASPGLDPQLERQFGKTDSFPVHALVYLSHLPTDTDREYLQKTGVQLMPNINTTLFLADLSHDFDFKAVSHLVDWAGPMFPEDKIEHWFWQAKVSKNKNTTGKVQLVVQFYGNVSPKVVDIVLGKHSSGFRQFGRNNFWEAETSYNKLMALAAEPAVRWIEEQAPNTLPTSK